MNALTRVFHNLTNLEDDSCNLTEKDIENKRFSEHRTTNFHICGMKKPVEFALQEPGVFFKGGVAAFSDAGGCNIDNDSLLRNGGIQTNPRCRISLNERLFTTVPYLGRGPHKPILESQLQQGEFVNTRRECGSVTEQTFSQQYTPLVSSLQMTINNPHNLVEEVADPNWVRGGVDTRDNNRQV